jgi:hypothetical protein
MNRTLERPLLFDLRRLESVDIQQLVLACHAVTDAWSRPRSVEVGDRLCGTWPVAWLRDQLTAELRRRILPDAELVEPAGLVVPSYSRQEASCGLLVVEMLAAEPLPERCGALVDLLAAHFRLAVATLAMR